LLQHHPFMFACIVSYTPSQRYTRESSRHDAARPSAREPRTMCVLTSSKRGQHDLWEQVSLTSIAMACWAWAPSTCGSSPSASPPGPVRTHCQQRAGLKLRIAECSLRYVCPFSAVPCPPGPPGLPYPPRVSNRRAACRAPPSPPVQLRLMATASSHMKDTQDRSEPEHVCPAAPSLCHPKCAV
jgi:hypothetical protein